MASPIPGVAVSTPYGKRGSYWSCNEDSNGNGIHTGVDYACASGTDVVAPIAGEVRHRSYGSSFGNHQFAISPDPGEPFGEGEVFFAHMTSRPADGTRVKIGDYLGNVGAEGNVSGPHLHFEYHANTKGKWSCSVIDDPKPVLDYQASGGKPDNPNKVEPGDTVFVISSGALNGRDEPSGEGDVVKTRPYGDKFVVLSVVDGWAQETP
jgi:murein DD-endopeptidase MepM/ murein hydrolase activator NlpD